MNNKTIKSNINKFIRNLCINNTQFNEFYNELSCNYTFYLIGGAIRDIINNSSPRDIDIITEENPENLINKLPKEIKVEKNSLKGYKIFFRSNIKVDLWDFENNWAFKQNLLEPSYKNISKGCFFNIDALVYSPVTGFLDIKGYEYSLLSKEIDFLNYEDEYINNNPGLYTNILRAFNTSKKFNLNLSKKLKNYLKCLYNNNTKTNLYEANTKHYKESKMTTKEVDECFEMICAG